MADDGIYVHPDAASSIGPHLKARLPQAAVSLYGVEVPPTADATVVATFPPISPPPQDGLWAVAVLGITGRIETDCWFWSSAEAAPAADDDSSTEEHFRAAYAQLEQVLRYIARLCPEKETLIIGSLHTRIAYCIPCSCKLYETLVWDKLLFTVDTLPPPDSRTEAIRAKYTFKRMESEDLDEVIKTSTVLRHKAALASVSSTGAYLASSEDKRAQAWCFISKEGAVSSVYVRPEVRGTGLGKETMRKELEKAFAQREYVTADVAPTNTASLRLCGSLGAQIAPWEVVWVRVLLDRFK
ncbi:hypothetical protein BC834DRAFT_872895 [Gloeopeniophorella convolvens]|nr:hypothetical protein BC834DRAFT_872895 [Gloeopeniophorella convolvens]